MYIYIHNVIHMHAGYITIWATFTSISIFKFILFNNYWFNWL